MPTIRISQIGRGYYLHAVEAYWPEALKSLQSDVFAIYEPLWVDQKEGRITKDETWDELAANPNRAEIYSALRSWGDRFLIWDAWIFDSALQSLSIYSAGGVWRWSYQTKGMSPEFRPMLPNPVWRTSGNGETWESFRARMDQAFVKELAIYRNTVQSMLSMRKAPESLAFDAAITARYQRGEPIHAIADSMPAGRDKRHQTLYRRVDRFAERIGLTLRKRGHRWGGKS